MLLGLLCCTWLWKILGTWTEHFWIRYWSQITRHLVLLFLLSFFLLGPKSEIRRRFKSDRDEIWQDCSSREYASVAWVCISDMTSYFQDGGHDVISRSRRVWRNWLAVCAIQYLIHSTFVLVIRVDNNYCAKHAVQNAIFAVFLYAVIVWADCIASNLCSS